MDPGICPICELTTAGGIRQHGDLAREHIDCPNCGKHWLDAKLSHFLHSNAYDSSKRAVIAYALRKRSGDPHIVTAEFIDDVLERVSLPNAMERVDNFVICLAGSGEPGTTIGVSGKEWRARLGCASEAGASWVIRQAQLLRLVEHGSVGMQVAGHYLTAEGWRRHAELLQTGARSKHAFMAMKFDDPVMRRLFFDHLQKAVEQTSFVLRTTDGPHQTAGSIDDRMRVEIRTSRFVVCDLTHGNRGAYWEAGFAEGVGRPVFYICRDDVLTHDDDEQRPHFDTAHQLIIGWNQADPGPAMEKLKAAIRATLPAEARMED